MVGGFLLFSLLIKILSDLKTAILQVKEIFINIGGLRQFNQLRGTKLLSRNTILIIMSDGWDTGEPEMLAAQMRAARRRALKILWLNPLLGLKDYQPITRGMAAALRYVDVFAPAHNLESLLALERHL